MNKSFVFLLFLFLLTTSITRLLAITASGTATDKNTTDAILLAPSWGIVSDCDELFILTTQLENME